MNEKHAAAALSALSNMGLELPSRAEVQSAMRIPERDAEYFVIVFGQKYIESEEIEEAMIEEAQSWRDDPSPRVWDLVRSPSEEDLEYRLEMQAILQSYVSPPTPENVKRLLREARWD